MYIFEQEYIRVDAVDKRELHIEPRLPSDISHRKDDILSSISVLRHTFILPGNSNIRTTHHSNVTWSARSSRDVSGRLSLAKVDACASQARPYGTRLSMVRLSLVSVQ